MRVCACLSLSISPSLSISLHLSLSLSLKDKCVYNKQKQQTFIGLDSNMLNDGRCFTEGKAVPLQHGQFVEDELALLGKLLLINNLLIVLDARLATARGKARR